MATAPSTAYNHVIKSPYIDALFKGCGLWTSREEPITKRVPGNNLI